MERKEETEATLGLLFEMKRMVTIELAVIASHMSHLQYYNPKAQAMLGAYKINATAKLNSIQKHIDILRLEQSCYDDNEPTEEEARGL